ncbi:MAG: formate dehydrogenase accessory protein FdhE [Vicinamibacterales bacterium]
MPYVALPPLAREARLAVARTRWEAILAVRPDLAPALALQRSLLEPVIDLTDTLLTGRLPRLSLPPRYLAAKLDKRVPALAAEPIPLPVATLRPTLLQLCRNLASGGAGDAALQIHAAIDAGTLDAGAVLGAALSRDQKAITVGSLHRRLQSELVWLVAELAVSPFVYGLQQIIVGQLNGGRSGESLASALDRWQQGYCPICGSWPALIETVEGRRMVRCSFCALAWTLTEPGCVYCGDVGPGFVTQAPDPRRPDRRLETCGRCRSYVKAVDVDELSPFPLLAIGDMETMDLDVMVMKQGFQRPALKAFSTAKAV